MSIVRLFFSRRWWFTTLLVLAAVAVMVRLGIWQLDRLDQRRAFNAHVLAQQQAPELNLNNLDPALSLDDLSGMEYRAVRVEGEYDPSGEIAIRNQAWNGVPGYTLLTPLRITGTAWVVMVQRGWVPLEGFTPDDLSRFEQPGPVQVSGIVRAARSTPDFGGRSDDPLQPGEFRRLWNLPNLEAIGGQLPYAILPVYVQRAPEPAYPENLDQWPMEMLPFPSQPKLELTEGPHMGYAIQWFIFASILGFGYPIFLRATEPGKKGE